jgi:NAD(P)-dependent dehydrogenase (short-subunit alcohol dehydrogenase family)
MKGEKAMSLFKGKIALVTGGTSGIGRTTAIAFAKEGAKVVVTGRREKEGAETIQLVKATGGESFFIKTDVSKEADVRMMVEKVLEAYGRLDYAFNNAGIEQVPTPLVEQTEEAFDQIININVKGVWLSMKYEIPQMLKNGGGAIVNMASVAGLIGFAGIPIYIASKHAVLGLTKSVALEYAKSGIRINAVSPAAIETDMVDRFVGKEGDARQQLASMHPVGRLGRPEEIADAVIYLCSDKASFITGQSLTVDGGFTAQ